MFKRHMITALTSACFLAASPVFAEEPSADTVVATVNGQDITLGHMIAARQNLPAEYQQLGDDVLFNGILDNLIQQSVMAQSLGDELSKTDMLSLENARRSYLAGAAVNVIVAESVTEEALQALYDETFTGVEPDKEYNASHILVETEDEAKKLVEELENGADFAELAKEKSTGPSGPNGGSLGWFGKGAMVPAFEEAVVALEEGAISAPVQTQFGWHVVKLNESRLKEAPTLDDVREQLAVQLEEDAVREAIEALTEKATIDRPDLSDIDQALLRDATLLDK